MSAFTKGPWRLEKPNKKSRNYVIWNNVGNIVINTGSGNDANARLIAAAPEMYEALTKMVEFFDPSLWHKNSPAMRASTDAETLLAKIKGE